MLTELSPAPVQTRKGRIDRLRRIAVRGLKQMFLPQERLFAFRVRKEGDRRRQEGISPRYTAIVALGLAGETPETVAEILGDATPLGHLDRLIADVSKFTNIGDVALTAWAAALNQHAQVERAYERLEALFEPLNAFHTVELSWVLSALCHGEQTPRRAALRDRAFEKLITAFSPGSAIFSHEIGGGLLRGHVACFADFVYPVQALSIYHESTGDADALRIANRCADRMCALLGPAGQWWWHFDVRSGNVVEGYPVYSVHQSSMAPMALFALLTAGGADHRDAIARGLDWLESSPELNGASLIDDEAGVVWRKVYRREPHKFVRRMQAVASRLHPQLRAPGMDGLFPPGAIDDESRPYHMGWILYAWPAWRAAEWDQAGGRP